MTDYLREIVLGLLVAGVTGSMGWFARTYLWRRKLRRKQRFLGLPTNSECVLVVNREAGTTDRVVARNDVFTMLELSALIKDCGANADVIAHDVTQQGFGERTEFCVGGPVSNHRMNAHLQSLLPGVQVNNQLAGGSAYQVSFTIGGERYAMEKGTAEYVLLARLTAGQDSDGRPVFLFCGQASITNQAAARYLSRQHTRLSRKYGPNGTFCLLLKVVNSQAYGPDVVQLVGDVTRAATTAPAPAGGNGGRRGGHRRRGDSASPQSSGQSSDSSA
ncbi:hypothetical protein [Streptomyces oceani]|uniref:Secreted protein n=1 Tax=Streptomyces oceani TaxID=1075402 RepID=A0A1E7KK17_9ACTN|nr:hypothetical protein [Streptomyces oceani]OEV04260.1 hypothetical protein AN216_08665 [Streptomyces oceani]